MLIDKHPQKSAGNASYAGVKVAILVTRFHQTIVDSLLTGALDMLKEQGVLDGDIRTHRVPGAFELPLAAQKLCQWPENGPQDHASRWMPQVVIALGCVIRGDTPHFDYVCAECARGLQSVSLKYQIPVIFGVLTTDTWEQAIARSATDLDGDDHSGSSNKGRESAIAALEMIDFLQDAEEQT